MATDSDDKPGRPMTRGSKYSPYQRMALAPKPGGGGEGPLQLPFDPEVELNLKTWGLTKDKGARDEAYKRHTPKE